MGWGFDGMRFHTALSRRLLQQEWPPSPELSDPAGVRVKYSEDYAGVGCAAYARDSRFFRDAGVVRDESKFPGGALGLPYLLEFYLGSESENYCLAHPPTRVLVILNNGLQEQEMGHLKETI